MQLQTFNSRVNLTGPEYDLYFKHLSGDLELDEPDLAFVAKNYLLKDAVYFDVGANLGVTSIPMAKYLKRGFVYAFEPSCAYDYLEENVKINSLSNIKLFNRALGEKEGEINFVTKYPLASSHRLIKANFTTETNFEKIRISKLDDIIVKEKINKLDFIKIDAAGFEKEVLQGCIYLIKRYSPIFYVKFNSWSLITHKNENPRIFLNFLHEKFTYLYWVKNNALHPLDSEEQLKEFLYINLTQNECVSNLICVNRNIEALKKSEFLFRGSDLPSEIGRKEDDFLISQENKDGCLSHGPYVSLLKGKYKVKIDLKSSSATNEELGCWEVYINQFNLVLKTGKIINSVDRLYKIEINFEVTDELSGSLFEIKTYSYGNGKIELKSISIEKIF